MLKKILIISFFIGALFRLINLTWGAPFYFHPDERNIANAVALINFPNQVNPHFFAYGSFPIYLIYFLSLLSNVFFKNPPFEQAILAGRLLESIVSILLIPSLYVLGKKLFDKQTGTIAAILCSFSIALIQFAHFGTFEMCLAFLSVWYVLSCITLVKKADTKHILANGVLLGLAIGTKVSSIVLLGLPLLLFFFKRKQFDFPQIFLTISQIATAAFIVFIVTNPFALLDYASFKNSMIYESSVALGQLPVFYTQAFNRTTPVIFQLLNIFPFLLNPFIEILFVISCFVLIFRYKKNRQVELFSVIAAFSLLFFSQAFFFAKWTRYMVPVVPFILLVVSAALSSFFEKNRRKGLALIVFCCLISLWYAFCFVKTLYLAQDSRIQAALWAKNNLNSQSKIVSEVYDLGIVPFNQYFPKIGLFNFYDFDKINMLSEKNFYTYIAGQNYIILPSTRISKTRITNNSDFPKGNMFYTKLFDGTLEYKKIYQTPCDFFCKFILATDRFFPLEETTVVFDRPAVTIFRKNER